VNAPKDFRRRALNVGELLLLGAGIVFLVCQYNAARGQLVVPVLGTV
jgi:hypothetical protein